MIRPQEKIRLAVDDNDARVAAPRDSQGTPGVEIDVGLIGGQTMEQIKTCVPDGILMAIRMLETDGVESFNKLRELTSESFVMSMAAFPNRVGPFAAGRHSRSRPGLWLAGTCLSCSSKPLNP